MLYCGNFGKLVFFVRSTNGAANRILTVFVFPSAFYDNRLWAQATVVLSPDL